MMNYRRGIQAAGVILGLILFPVWSGAVGEILIDQVAVAEHPPTHYDVTAMIRNQTGEPREVTVRAQVFFFEKDSPKGDVPVMVLRKDETLVLNSQEIRQINVRLFNEGSFPKGNLRLKTEVRLRRQRPWNY